MSECDLLRRSLLLGGLAAALSPAVAASPQRGLLIYVGTTMVPPITQLGLVFERSDGTRLSIAQGTSDGVYRSAKKARVGDLYLPGDPGYLDRHRSDGLFGEQVTVGQNRLAIVVPKGNPKGVTADLESLLRADLRVMIGGPDSSSVGAETRTVLEAAGIYAKVAARTPFLAPHSRGLSTALRHGEADAILNWRATALFPENVPVFDLIDLDPGIARPHALRLTLLTLSRSPEVARRFMALAASETGRAIFQRFGFIEAAAATAPSPL